MERLKLEIAPHGVRFLVRVLYWTRKRMVENSKGLSLQFVAGFDSLEELENSIPDDIYQDEMAQIQAAAEEAKGRS